MNFVYLVASFMNNDYLTVVVHIWPVRGELLISLEEYIAMTLLPNHAFGNGTAIPAGY